MDKTSRQKLLYKIEKKAEQKKLLDKVAEDQDINNAVDAEDYSEKLFDKLINDIKIDGLED